MRPNDGTAHYSLDRIFPKGHNGIVSWDVEFTDEFETWWHSLTEEEQAKVDASVRLLIHEGPTLDHPHTSSIAKSKHSKMRELRTQVGGRPFRVLYAFDPRRSAILLVGGDKTGNDNWYDIHVPIADKLYDAHLEQLRREKASG